MREYFRAWKQYVCFSGKTSRREFWMTVLWHIIVIFLLQIVIGMSLILITDWAFDRIEQILAWILQLYCTGFFLPMLAVTVRRLNDAGYSVKSLLWLLIPGIGMIAVLARLCTERSDAFSETANTDE